MEAEKKPRSRQAQLGQYFTPGSIAAFMAGMFGDLPEKVRLLDSGAGNGALTAAFVVRAQQADFKGSISVTAFEKDELVLKELRSAFSALANRRVATEIVGEWGRGHHHGW